MMMVLGIVAITLTCASVAAGISLIVFVMMPDIRRIWRRIKLEEKKRKEAEKKRTETTAKVIKLSMYTYDRNRKLVNLGEYSPRTSKRT